MRRKKESNKCTKNLLAISTERALKPKVLSRDISSRNKNYAGIKNRQKMGTWPRLDTGCILVLILQIEES